MILRSVGTCAAVVDCCIIFVYGILNYADVCNSYNSNFNDQFNQFHLQLECQPHQYEIASYCCSDWLYKYVFIVFFSEVAKRSNEDEDLILHDKQMRTEDEADHAKEMNR